MKIQFFLSLLVISIGVVAGCNEKDSSTAVPQIAQSDAIEVNHDTTVAALDEILIDVRSQEEWDGGHLDNAILIPHEDISDRIADVTTNKSAKIVLY